MRDKDENKDPTQFTEEDQEQRDKLLRKLLTTPPQPRPKRGRNEGKSAKKDEKSGE
jgi:hypothetical protein